MATLNKTLKFWDIVLFTFCAIFGIEAVATAAAIGPSAISWWIICAIGYFFPSGLVMAELSSTYPEQGGFYVWIEKAFGHKWAARSIWYYWISQPLWLPAIYIAIAEIFSHMFFPGLDFWWQIFICIILIWVTFVINISPLKISKWVPNLGSITKLSVIAAMVIAAAIFLFKNGGMANELTIASIMPSMGAAVIFIPMIIYNLVGCELVAGMAGEMKNPARDIPKALFLSTIVILGLYLVTTLAIWTVIPIQQINIASGIVQMFQIAFAGSPIAQTVIVAVGALFILTLFTTIIPWNLSANRVMAEAAKERAFPKVFAIMTGNMAPLGASIVAAVISTVVVLIYGFIAQNAAELFWHVVSFSLVVNLLSYAIIFPSFIVLRTKNKNIRRPYKIPGPEWLGKFLALLAEVFIVLSAAILIIQPGNSFYKASLPIIVGALTTIIIGEILLVFQKSKNSG